MAHSLYHKPVSSQGSLPHLGSQSVRLSSAVCLGQGTASGLPVQVAILDAEEGSLETGLQDRKSIHLFPDSFHRAHVRSTKRIVHRSMVLVTFGECSSPELG